ncbi:MAG: phosphatidylglycerol lysyltransferase domain-containing protein [Christensenellales bacterium]
MHFRRIEEQDFCNIDKMLAKTEYNGSEYSQLYLKGWKFFNFESMQIAYEKDVIYLRFVPHAEYFDDESGVDGYVYLPPLTTLDKIPSAYDALDDYCNETGNKLYVMSTPQEYVDIIDADRYKWSINHDYDEYLYSPQDLINLEGKKYHAKRNHVKKFVETYSHSVDGKGYVFRSYCDDDYDNVMQLITGWQNSKSFDEEYSDAEADEYKLVKMALGRVSVCPHCFADVIEYDGRIIAFSMGEITASGVGITHIEKGDIAYNGVYPALCQMFAKKHYENCRIVNRQEDMGLEGLRRSKRSLYPIGFAKKYAVESAIKN